MCANASVLIVDDETFLRQILTRIVKREGYSVAEAADGVEALEKLKSRQFEFVISDIKMPRMDGLELLAEIKSNWPDTKVLLITNYEGEYSAEMAIASGADFYITKPFKNVEIARSLHNLRSRGKRKAIAK